MGILFRRIGFKLLREIGLCWPALSQVLLQRSSISFGTAEHQSEGYPLSRSASVGMILSANPRRAALKATPLRHPAHAGAR